MSAKKNRRTRIWETIELDDEIRDKIMEMAIEENKGFDEALKGALEGALSMALGQPASVYLDAPEYRNMARLDVVYRKPGK